MPLLESFSMFSKAKLSRSPSPAPSKPPNKIKKSAPLPRRSHDLAPIEVFRPSTDDRAFRSLGYTHSSASTTSLSTAESVSSLGRREGARMLSSSTSSRVPTSPTESSMGFGRQARRPMGALREPKNNLGMQKRMSRSTSELSRITPSPVPTSSSRQSSDLISFLNFDSDSDGSDDESQEFSLTSCASSAVSSQGALTPPADASTRDVPVETNTANRVYMGVPHFDSNARTISAQANMDLPPIRPKTPTPHFTPSSPSIPTIKTEYVSPTSAAPGPGPSPSLLPPVPSFISITVASSDGHSAADGGLIHVGMSSEPVEFDESRRPSEVSISSFTTTASDLTIDARTGEPRRRSSVYDASFFEKIMSPALDKFPSPPPSATLSPASSPTKSQTLSRVDEGEEPVTPTTSSPSIESLLAMVSAFQESVDIHSSPPAIPRAKPAPTQPVPMSPMFDSPPRAAPSPPSRRGPPPAPLRFNLPSRVAPPSHNVALRRAPSILSPTASLSSSFSSSIFDDSSRMSSQFRDSLFDITSPEYDMPVVVRMGGLEDINEEMESTGFAMGIAQ
ncbi:hypothetical protein DL93DRAFT_435494 [Clavulina sp. PMI_390]|nr:hypothetical protein DL93DRAFT_435494 [Clavulina sp. PMI_390]